MTSIDPDPITTLQRLRERFPTTPFLALGQTVWWDEPMKAVLRVLLDEHALGGELVLGVHDTDYFAKLHSSVSGQSRFALLPHNDGATRDLWSAAGEISKLFGSECLPSRQDLVLHSVQFRRLAAVRGASRQAFLNSKTAAWGWRGLVYTGSRDMVVRELQLADVAPGIRTMLDYGFDGTIKAIGSSDVAASARRRADQLITECCDCCRANPDATLTTLYKHMYPRLFEALMGRPLSSFRVTSTSELLRFDPESASLPRFRLVDLFLQPETRRIASEAYDYAVGGSEMYTLERFGLGALPFDLIVPGRGRGTIRVTLRAVHVETRDPIRIRTVEPVRSARQLARVLAENLGDDLILVGKAVTLISMLAGEFIFVFNEEGSGYVKRTRTMNDRLTEHGVPMAVHPILRMHYQTWDAARDVSTEVTIPRPMSRAFGAQSLPLGEFASRWRQVTADQEALLETLAGIRSPRRLLSFLRQRCPGRWSDRVRRYSELTEAILGIVGSTRDLERQTEALYEELRDVRRQIVEAERARGDHFRSITVWTETDEQRRAELGSRIHELVARLRDLTAHLRHVRRQRLEIGRGATLTALRAERESIELEAEAARLELVRNAILTARGLEHCDHRPSAWWLPFVDPSGAWFRRVVETARIYVEPLTTT